MSKAANAVENWSKVLTDLSVFLVVGTDSGVDTAMRAEESPKSVGKVLSWTGKGKGVSLALKTFGDDGFGAFASSHFQTLGI
eukprot:5783794-Amphidinium_carterae.1